MIKYLKPLPVSSSTGVVSEMYKQIKSDFGLVGDIFIMHSLSPPLLAGLWAALRESELVGIVPRDVKEVVATAVSKSNQCPFCVDAHSMLVQLAGNKEVAQKISKHQTDEITDEKMKSIINWALATRSPNSPILLDPPFTAQEAPEIIGTAVITHYINRMIDVLLSQKSPIPINNSLLKKILIRLIALLFSSSVRKSRRPGESLRFLPEVSLPEASLHDDFRWARSNPIISRAFAGFASAMKIAGENSLTEEVRSIVLRFIDDWDGKEPGLSRNWVEQTVKSLNGPSKIIAKLSLLTAIAPYQIDDDLIQDFRSVYKEDFQLLNVLSWSSFMAARKIGSWLCVPDERV